MSEIVIKQFGSYGMLPLSSAPFSPAAGSCVSVYHYCRRSLNSSGHNFVASADKANRFTFMSLIKPEKASRQNNYQTAGEQTDIQIFPSGVNAGITFV